MPQAATADLYPSRTRARLETRARVRDAAVAEFHRVGFEASQIEDIVRAASVARGTFYLHFPTKDHVLMELLAESSASVAGALDGADPERPGRVLRDVVDAIATEVVGEHAALVPDVFALIARNRDAVAARTPELAERLTGFLATASEAGTVRRDAPATDLAAIFLSSVVGLLLTRRESSPRGLRSALRRAVELLEPVLLVEEAGRARDPAPT